MTKIVQSLNKNVFNGMTNLFRNVHALIKKRRPITDFIWMCELDEICTWIASMIN
jgi:hypothetical protein